MPVYLLNSDMERLIEMFKKILVANLNRKYAGKELMFCERVYGDICFYPYSIQQCCFCTKVPYSPPLLFLKKLKNFSFFQYIKNVDRIMSSNQKSKSPCGGCKFLKKQQVPKFPEENNITFLTINHFTKCNSNCIYCAIGSKTEDIKYKLLPIVKQMIKSKMISKDCLINWGGGEPTMCSEFEDIAEYFKKNGIRQAVNSSGIIFSPIIWDGLKDGSMSIQISPDSGTEETYLKIKRQNNFNKVWENIGKYAVYPDMLFVKYIFFSMSANENDVRKFIDKCVQSGVKNIVIDCESNSANNPHSPFGRINDEILKLAVLMKHLAEENGIKYQISYQWRSEHKNFIEEN